MTTRDPIRLRELGSRLPYALRRGLQPLPDPGPTPQQLADLRKRLAPLAGVQLEAPRPSVARVRPRSLPSRWLGIAIAATMLPLAVAAGVQVWTREHRTSHVPAGSPTAPETPPPSNTRSTPSRQGIELPGVEPTARSSEPTPAVAAPAILPTERSEKIAPTTAPPNADSKAASDPPLGPSSAAEQRPLPSFVTPTSPSPHEALPAGRADDRWPLPPEAEIELLRQAIMVLDSNPARALALTNDLERTIRDGTLRQEREVVAIKALVKLGQSAHARARLARFREDYPTSIHLPQLEAIVRGGS